MSSLNALSQQSLVEVKREDVLAYNLTREGRDFLENGTPERRLYQALNKTGEAEFEVVFKAAKLGEVEKNIALQWAKKNSWVEIAKKEGKTVLQPAPKSIAKTELSALEKTLGQIAD